MNMARRLCTRALYAVAAFCCICCIGLSSGVAFAVEPETPDGSGEVGLVLSLTPGVTAERAGQNLALEQKSPVNTTDVLHTDATGRAQILFADDSSVSLGSNTSLALEEVVAEGKNPVFKARLGQGMARFITGKIVEQNPDGFAVVTPEATVGIRGTIFAVSTNDGKTTVYVMNTTRQVLVNGILVPSGYKITLPDGMPEPMTPADLNQASEATAARKTQDQTDGAASDDNLDLADAGGNTVFDPDTLEQPELGTQLVGDELADLGSNPAAATATVTGALLINPLGGLNGTDAAGATAVGNTGSFSFNVNLDSGAISNASMSNSIDYTDSDLMPANISYSLSGGSGQINGNSFDVGNMTGTGAINGDPILDNVSGAMTNGITSLGPNGELMVNGDYNVDIDDMDNTWDIQENGGFTNQPR